MKRNIASQRYSQAGVSLIELMVGLTVGLIITAGAFTVLFSNQKLILEKDVMDRSQENFRFASTTITRLVRQATSFGFPANNNELIVYFDSSQRDCLGEQNHSSVNTFKLNTDNELVCELVLNDGTIQTVTLAKNISGLKFAYGIQNGTGTTPLVYQPYLDSSGTVNSTVNNVWGTITSVLSQISINDGGAKQPTIDFIATSHLRAMTQLASTGGTSLVNPPSGTGTGGTGTGGTGTGGTGTGGTGTGGTGTGGTGTQAQCSSTTMLANLNVSGTGFSSAKWNAISNPIIANGQSVSVSVATDVAITGWKIQKDSSGFNDLQMTNSFTLPSGNKQPMSLTVKCGEYVSSPINFVTPNCPSDVLGKINVTYNGNVTKTWSALPETTNSINNKSTVKVDVSQVVDKGDWKLQWQYNNSDINIEPLTNWTSGQLQGQDRVTLTLQCGNENPSVRTVSR